MLVLVAVGYNGQYWQIIAVLPSKIDFCCYYDEIAHQTEFKDNLGVTQAKS